MNKTSPNDDDDGNNNNNSRDSFNSLEDYYII